MGTYFIARPRVISRRFSDGDRQNDRWSPTHRRRGFTGFSKFVITREDLDNRSGSLDTAICTVVSRCANSNKKAVLPL
jgi:hypothetical protein